MIHAKFASLTSFSTEETVLFSAPPRTPLFGWKRGQNVFEERNFQNFLPGLHDNRGERGRHRIDVVIDLVVLVDCSSRWQNGRFPCWS